jgi:anti-sigma factor RsiW
MSQFEDGTLVAFVDSELDAVTARKVEAAIAVDREMNRKVELLRLSGSIVREAFRSPEYERVSPLLAQKLAGLGRSQTGRSQTAQFQKPRSRFSWRVALPIAASIAAAVIGFGAGVRHAGPGDFAEYMMDEVAEYHAVYAREGEHQVEVKADRLDEIQSWLGDRLQRRLRVPDLTDQGLTFRGARLLVVDKRPVAQLLYSSPQSPDHPFGLCITTGTSAEMPLKMDDHDDLNLAFWAHQGFVYILVGWLDKPELEKISAKLRPELDQI